MKCASFSLRCKNSSKRLVTKPTDDDYNLPTNKEFITEFFDSSKPLLNSESKTLVIEPKINTCRPPLLKKLKNIHLPIEESYSGVSSNGSVEFESSAVVDSGSLNLNLLPNGLNLRRRKTVNKEEGGSFVRIDTVIANNLKDDLEKLPDAMGFDEDDDCPVDDFAAAVLRGYGWSEGRGIGRNTSKDVKVVDYERRTGREGIGFAAAAPPHTPSSKSSKDEEKLTMKIEDKKRDYKTRRGVRWLTSNIKVRIISKKLKRGKLYLRMGKVVDVVGPSACDILMDDSRELIQGVDQEFLETAIPRTGVPILVLYGKYKGVYGSLLQKDMEQETAIVEDADTRSVHQENQRNILVRNLGPISFLFCCCSILAVRTLEGLLEVQIISLVMTMNL